jgi:hypothetical protein
MLVVGSTYFKQLGDQLKLTLVDGIIGDYFSQEGSRNQIKRFCSERIGVHPDEWENLTYDEKQTRYQDYIFKCEIDTDYKNNPICKELEKLECELGIHNFSFEYLMGPDADKDATPVQRATAYEDAEMIGAKVTVPAPKGNIVSVTIWLPNTGIISAPGTLAQHIAHLLALDQIKRESAK